VLGIKGTLSVVELKVLRQRMQAGQESKARCGELFKRLPVSGHRVAISNHRLVAFEPRIDARCGDPSYKLAYQALAAFPTYR
jgi:hypothetical protein